MPTVIDYEVLIKSVDVNQCQGHMTSFCTVLSLAHSHMYMFVTKQSRLIFPRRIYIWIRNHVGWLTMEAEGRWVSRDVSEIVRASCGPQGSSPLLHLPSSVCCTAVWQSVIADGADGDFSSVDYQPPRISEPTTDSTCHWCLRGSYNRTIHLWWVS